MASVRVRAFAVLVTILRPRGHREGWHDCVHAPQATAAWVVRRHPVSHAS